LVTLPKQENVFYSVTNINKTNISHLFNLDFKNFLTLTWVQFYSGHSADLFNRTTTRQVITAETHLSLMPHSLIRILADVDLLVAATVIGSHDP
jgi:hypothetical protein